VDAGAGGGVAGLVHADHRQHHPDSSTLGLPPFLALAAQFCRATNTDHLLVFGRGCSFHPSQRALSRTLRDALDVYHQKFSETVVKIVRLEEMGVSVEQVPTLSLLQALLA